MKINKMVHLYMGLKSHMYLYTYKVLCIICIHNCTRRQQSSIPAFKYFKASEKKWWLLLVHQLQAKG